MGRPLDNLSPTLSLAWKSCWLKRLSLFHHQMFYPSSPIPQLLLQSLHWPQLDTLQFRGSEGKYFFFSEVFWGKFFSSFILSFFSEPYRALHLGTFFYYYVFSFGEGDTPWHFSSNFPTAVNIPFPFLNPRLHLLFKYNNLYVTTFFFCVPNFRDAKKTKKCILKQSWSMERNSLFLAE